ncbi:MAG: hypothetical protein KAR42_13575 [candidate division Zixibacteria bacterium]|nr:hypothetical protein [candidate division Zixibacteria bacterium]
MKLLSILICFTVFCCHSMTTADCTLIQTEKIGIPILFDAKYTVTTQLSDEYIKVSYERSGNFLTNLLSMELGDIPTRIYSLPDTNRISLYDDNNTFSLKPLTSHQLLYDSVLAKTKTLGLPDSIGVEWQISAISQTRDTISGIACMGLGLTAEGISYNPKEIKTTISAKLWLAENNEQNKPLNAPYGRFRKITGFDPLNHYTTGLILASSFGVPIKSFSNELTSLEGFPVKMEMSLSIYENDDKKMTLSYSLNVKRINDSPVPQTEFIIPASFTQTEESDSTDLFE